MAPVVLIITSLCYSQKTHDKSFQRFAIHGFAPAILSRSLIVMQKSSHARELIIV
jgi:hypothetical protein